MNIGNSPAIQRIIPELKNQMPGIANWLLSNPNLEMREFFSMLEFDDKKAENADQHFQNENKIILPSIEILNLLVKLEEDLDVNHGLYEQTNDEQYGLEMERLLDDIDFATKTFEALITQLEESGIDFPSNGSQSMTLAEIKTARDTAYDVYRVALVHESPNSPNLKKMHREYVYWDHVFKAARIRGIKEADAQMDAEAEPRPDTKGDD